MRQTFDDSSNSEAIALQVLGFIASDPDMLGQFMSISGLDVDSLRSNAAHPNFLAGVMDYLLGDESLLLAFAESADIDPRRIAAARHHLPGGVS